MAVSKSSNAASSNASTKKKTSSGATSSGTTFKCPDKFIVRPHPVSGEDYKDACILVLNSQVLKHLEMTSKSSMALLIKEGFLSGLVGTVLGSDDLDLNVIQISKTLRAVGSVILGDRVSIAKLGHQPGYANSVQINCRNTVSNNEISKQLTDCGLVMPGMQFKDFFIADCDHPLEQDTLSEEISNLSITTGHNLMNTFAPVKIFNPKVTKIEVSETVKVNSKYNLPQTVSYNQIGGLGKEIEVLKKCIDIPLSRPEIFSDFGVSPPRGILLHGPPGTGKTMLLRSVANECDAHVLSINGPSIVSKYLGETESALRNIFNEARKYQPSIIFMDEVDSLAPHRGSDDSGEVESRVVATLLTLMDGFHGGLDKLVIVGATNRPNAIDPALRRPGRFDQECEIGIPDVEARNDILQKQFAKMGNGKCQMTPDEIHQIALKTHGYVGADLVALVRESVMKCIQRCSTAVSFDDIDQALVEIRPSAMREIFLEMPKVHWSDIGGQADLKRKMREMIQLPLECGPVFQKLGVQSPKGVLLYGPPGCSKTLTAKALATESGINFLAVKGPEIFNKYVGESEKTIREIFRKARAAAPSIIFFDEIDALSATRDNGGSNSVSGNVLTTLLNEIDGVEELKGVIIVAATNRPDEIDPALLRPGRLDRHVYVGPPDLDARLQILQKCTGKFDLDASISNKDEYLRKLATATDGCSGAEVVLLCQEAGLNAIMESLDKTELVKEAHFDHALASISKGITAEMLEYYQDFASRSGIVL